MCLHRATAVRVKSLKALSKEKQVYLPALLFFVVGLVRDFVHDHVARRLLVGCVRFIVIFGRLFVCRVLLHKWFCRQLKWRKSTSCVYMSSTCIGDASCACTGL